MREAVFAYERSAPPRNDIVEEKYTGEIAQTSRESGRTSYRRYDRLDHLHPVGTDNFIGTYMCQFPRSLGWTYFYL